MGRARELDELRTCLDEALAGRGRLILLSGEPGIGKTRLAEELSEDARAAGARVVWGRSWEGDGSPVFWPWVQVIRELCESLAPSDLAARLGAGGAFLAGIVPEIAAKLRDPSRAPASPESEGSRFYLFDAVATFLRRVAEELPLVIVLDDLHWADRSSLVLLEFVARQMRDARIFAIGTHREGESRAGGPVAEVFGGAARRLPLRGLSEAEVALLMERHWGKSPDASLVAAVYGSTDGNPFFVDEIVRLLAAEGINTVGRGARLPIPEGVSATIARRVRSLPESCRRLLSLAAVAGRDFDAKTLARASGAPRNEVVALLQSAIGSALVTKLDGARYRFAHALVRETLYESLDATTRAELHEQVGLALEELDRADPESRLAELAHHFVEAASPETAARAADYARRASRRAMSLYAFEEAARLSETALRVLETHAPDDGAGRGRLLLQLANARRRSGDVKGAMDICLRVVETARRLDAPDLLASAAVVFGQGSRETGRKTDVAVRVLDEALAALPATDSALRVHLLGRFATSLAWRDAWAEPGGRRDALAREAVETAGRLGDARVLADALWSRLEALEDPENAAERLDAATKLVEAAGRAGDRSLGFAGHYHRLWNLTVLGEIGAVDLELDACARWAEEAREPFIVAHTTMSRAMRALHRGLLDESERLALEALQVATQIGSRNVASQMRDLLAVLRTEQDRLAEIEPFLRHTLDQNPAEPGVRETLAFVLTELGRKPEARVELERLPPGDAPGLPRADRGFFTVAARLADLAASLEDRPLAERLYERLRPYARINLTFAAAITFGSGARFLGVLAATLGRQDEAAAHFEDALRENARMGAVPWLAHTRLEYARLLFARGEPARARALLAEAVETAQALGMKRLLRRAEGVEAEIPAAASPPPGRPDEPGPSTFRRDGAHWTISHQGVVFRLKDSRGLRAIAHLLRHPRLEFHVAELVTLVGGATGSARPEPDAAALAAEGLRAGGLGDAGAHLDAAAKAAYRARLEDLREELEEALRNDDTGRAAKAREEIDFLGEELSRAVGLGGRDRKAADANERARLNVTRAIRGAIDKIAGFSAPLEEYLSAAIRTGTYCRYEPPADTPVAWDLGPD